LQFTSSDIRQRIAEYVNAFCLIDDNLFTKILTLSQSIETFCDSTLCFWQYVIKSEKYKNKKIIVGSNYLCDIIKMKIGKKDSKVNW